MAKLKNKEKRGFLILIMTGILILAGGVSFLFLTREKETPNEPVKELNEVPKEPEKKLNILDLNSKSRPYAVMINNNIAVWGYQSGLNDAYIIYEMLVEGGITREMALFKDKNTTKIQSIRSSRHYFIDYALENDAIYVHWGQSFQAQSDLATLGINNLNGIYLEGSYFFRDSSVKAAYEHKGYTTMEYLRKATERKKYRTTTESGTLLDYSIESQDLNSIEGAVDAKYIEVPYSSGYKAKFFYDEETKLYKRSQNNKELIDFTSKERITTKNLIVYNVTYKTLDSYGRQDMDNIGSGNGYYISEGKAIPITWEKSSRASKTIYKLPNGEKLKVNDGATYIGLEPTNHSIVIKDTLPE